ncbi:hypothetical protein KJ359_013149 [Pestalotiopsis sp. 9143b]|nr:hypothetical protein KJ359_013149 [Pestalotiopsis sp. 9143b]
MAASASKETFFPADVFPEPEFFHGDTNANVQGRTTQERAVLLHDLLQNSIETSERRDGAHVLRLDFDECLDPSDPEATCSDKWPRSAAEAKFLEGFATYRQYYGRLLFRHLPRKHLATNVVLSALQQIVPGSLPQESRVWRRVEERLVNCITRASKIEWNAEHTLFAHFPELEDLEALMIYGSTDKGLGRLPEEMDTLLKQAGLYFLVVSPDERIIPRFWKRNILRIGWKQGVDYCRIQGDDEPPRPDSDGSASPSGSPRNPPNVLDGKTGMESWEQIYKLTTELQAERALLPRGLMGKRAEWHKELMQEMDHLVDSLTMISQDREAPAKADEALRLANGNPRKRQRDGTQSQVSKETEKATQAAEALRLVKAIRVPWEHDDSLQNPAKRQRDDI